LRSHEKDRNKQIQTHNGLSFKVEWFQSQELYDFCQHILPPARRLAYDERFNVIDKVTPLVAVAYR